MTSHILGMHTMTMHLSRLITLGYNLIYFLIIPGRGYYPKPSKIVLIVHLNNFASGKEFGLRHRFKVCMGAGYLGSFIGAWKSKRDWLKYWMSKWDKNIRAITETARKYTQDSYAVVVHAIQSKWIFL